MFQLLALITVAVLSNSASAVLDKHVRPVIGVLTIPPAAKTDDVNFSTIHSTYVRWLQSGGAVVVPILFNDTAANIEALFPKLSGVLFTGGPAKPTDFNRYYATASLLYNMSLMTNMPLWGTCLGFQTISDLVGGGDVLSDFEAEDLELPLHLTEAAASSKMFGSASSDTIDEFTKSSYTTNWHHYGVSPETFDSTLAPGGLVALSWNTDSNGLEFISSMEHATAPIYAVQYHPEANAFNWDHDTVDHTSAAVSTMQYLSNFFINEAREKGLGRGDEDLSLGPLYIDLFPLKAMPLTQRMQFVFE